LDSEAKQTAASTSSLSEKIGTVTGGGALAGATAACSSLGTLPHNVFPGKPTNTMLFDKLDPHTLGMLVALFDLDNMGRQAFSITCQNSACLKQPRDEADRHKRAGNRNQKPLGQFESLPGVDFS
jgi:hypothetical protein